MALGPWIFSLAADRFGYACAGTLPIVSVVALTLPLLRVEIAGAGIERMGQASAGPIRKVDPPQLAYPFTLASAVITPRSSARPRRRPTAG